MATKRAQDFPAGTNVYYVPLHAKGDLKHKDVEKGVVKDISIPADLVFVMFGADTTAKACRPETLQLIEEEKADNAKTPPAPTTGGTSGDAPKAPGAVPGGAEATVDKGQVPPRA